MGRAEKPVMGWMGGRGGVVVNSRLHLPRGLTGVAIETDFPIRNFEIKTYLSGYFDIIETYRAQLKIEVREYPARSFGDIRYSTTNT